MKVALRKRPGKKHTSLFLDIYYGKDEKRKHESLPFKLINNPETPFERKENKDNQEKAELYLSKRRMEIQNEFLGIPSYRPNLNFLKYFEEFAEKEFNRQTSGFKFKAVLFHLTKFVDGRELRFKDVTEDFCNDFMYYLKNDATNHKTNSLLSTNTAAVYFRKFKRVLHSAYREGIIAINPIRDIQGIKDVKTQREFLELYELKKIIHSEGWKKSPIKKAFIFSCYTGLRRGDICELKWNQIKFSEEKGWYLDFTHQKTREFDRLYLPDHVYNLIGPKKMDAELVFVGIDPKAAPQIPKWIRSCGVNKHITFHCARHTNATLLLSMGADLYTVSKILGHSNLATTEIYLHLLDEKSHEASRLIPDLMGG